MMGLTQLIILSNSMALAAGVATSVHVAPKVALISPQATRPEIAALLPQLMHPGLSRPEQLPASAVRTLQSAAADFLKSGPIFAFATPTGVAILPSAPSAEGGGVFVPFDAKAIPYDGKKTVKPVSIALTSKAAGKISELLGRGDYFTAGATLSRFFDGGIPSSVLSRDWVFWTRTFFKLRNQRDLDSLRGIGISVVRARSIPAPVRAYVEQFHAPVVYAWTRDGKRGYAVFENSTSVRAAIFGPGGEPLGFVQTRTKPDPWEKEQLEASRLVREK